MSAPVKLAAFAAALVFIFAASFGVGAATGGGSGRAAEPAGEMDGMDGMDDMDHTP